MLVVVGGLSTFACGGEAPLPSQPSPPISNDQPAVPRGLQILGAPTNVWIQETAPLRAVVSTDVGWQEVTAQTTWRSSDENVCAVSPAGLVEGRAAGVATVTAMYSGLDATVSLTCGYQISAVVRENAPMTHILLGGVRVEVVGGPLDGRVLFTDDDGRVTLPPVAGPPFSIFFRKLGFDDQRLEIFELPRQTSLDVSLMPAPSRRIELSGVCDGVSPAIEVPARALSTSRRGRIVLRASTMPIPADWPRVCGWVWPNPRGIPNQAIVSNCSGRTPTSLEEVVAAAGDYELTVQPLCSLGNRGTQWQVVVEHVQ